MTPESRSFPVTGPPHVSLLFDLFLPSCPFIDLIQSAASVIAACVSGLPHVTSNSSDAEKENVLVAGQIASGDLPLSQTNVRLV